MAVENRPRLPPAHRTADLAHTVRAHNAVQNVHAIAGAGRSERHECVRSSLAGSPGLRQVTAVRFAWFT
jgi:hypothetical protein